MTDAAKKGVKRAWDITKVIGAIATAAVAGFGWLEARETSRSTTNDTAATELKVDKAYTTLAEAVKELAQDNREQRKVVSDLRVAVAELKGALMATNTRATRILEESDALKEIEPPPEPEPEDDPGLPESPDVASMGRVGGGGGASSGVSLFKPVRKAKSKSALDLPEQIQVEQQAVEQYIEQKKAK